MCVVNEDSIKLSFYVLYTLCFSIPNTCWYIICSVPKMHIFYVFNFCFRTVPNVKYSLSYNV